MPSRLRRRKPSRYGPIPRHQHADDRFTAPLVFREWLFIAMAKRAIDLARRRRRRARAKLQSILAVADRGELWLQRRQEAVLDIYRQQLAYLERPAPISTKTLSRNIAAMKRQKLLTVDNYSRFDERRGVWLQLPNIYIITRLGILWINRAARGIKIPPVV